MDNIVEILTVTKTTFLPSVCCLRTNSRTLSTSCCSVSGGDCVSKYDSAEKVVGPLCMLVGSSNSSHVTVGIQLSIEMYCSSQETTLRKATWPDWSVCWPQSRVATGISPSLARWAQQANKGLRSQWAIIDSDEDVEILMSPHHVESNKNQLRLSVITCADILPPLLPLRSSSFRSSSLAVQLAFYWYCHDLLSHGSIIKCWTYCYNRGLDWICRVPQFCHQHSTTTERDGWMHPRNFGRRSCSACETALHVGKTTVHYMSAVGVPTQGTLSYFFLG